MTLVGGSIMTYFSPNAGWSWRFDELYKRCVFVDLVGVGDLKIRVVNLPRNLLQHLSGNISTWLIIA